jgi:hypothetical protein
MLIKSYVGLDTSDNTVTLPSATFTTIVVGQTAYSGVRFGSDGNVYRNSGTSDSSWQVAGTWLVKGTNSNYDITRTINGSLNTDAGDALVLSTNRDYYVIDTTTLGGAVTCEVEFSITDTTQSTTYVTRTYSFYAEKTASTPQ